MKYNFWPENLYNCSWSKSKYVLLKGFIEIAVVSELPVALQRTGDEEDDVYISGRSDLQHPMFKKCKGLFCSGHVVSGTGEMMK